MKKLRLVSLCLSLLMLWPTLAIGEGRSYSIRELPGVTFPRWQEIYEAYGRTIPVDVEIEIPSVETAPVILVQAASPLPDTRVEELQAFCTSAMETDEVNSYSFQSTPFSTAYDHATPPIWGKTRKDDASYNQAVMGWDSHLLSDYRMDAAYADNNALLLGDAVAAAKKQVSELFPNDSLDLPTSPFLTALFPKRPGIPSAKKAIITWNFTRSSTAFPSWGAFTAPSPPKPLGMKTIFWKAADALLSMFGTRIPFCSNAFFMRKPALCGKTFPCFRLTT